MQNPNISSHPQHLHLPRLNPPHPLFTLIPHNIHIIQVSSRKRRILLLHRVLRSHVISNSLASHFGHICTLLDFNANICDTQVSDIVYSFETSVLLLVMCMVTRSNSTAAKLSTALQPLSVRPAPMKVMSGLWRHAEAKREWSLVSTPRRQRWRASAMASRGVRVGIVYDVDLQALFAVVWFRWSGLDYIHSSTAEAPT